MKMRVSDKFWLITVVCCGTAAPLFLYEHEGCAIGFLFVALLSGSFAWEERQQQPTD